MPFQHKLGWETQNMDAFVKTPWNVHGAFVGLFSFLKTLMVAFAYFNFACFFWQAEHAFFVIKESKRCQIQQKGMYNTRPSLSSWIDGWTRRYPHIDYSCIIDGCGGNLLSSMWNPKGLQLKVK